MKTTINKTEKVTALFNEYYKQLHAFVTYKLKGNEQRANDIMSLVFEKVFLNIDTFDAQKANIKTWLFTITKNTLIDDIRASKRQNLGYLIELTHEGKDDEEFYFQPQSSERADKILLNCEMKNDIKQATKKLNSSQKRVYKLFYKDGYPISEICDMLNMPINTVKVELHRIRQKMKAELMQYSVI